MAAEIDPRLRVDVVALAIASRPHQAGLVDEIGVAEHRDGPGKRACNGEPGRGQPLHRTILWNGCDRVHQCSKPLARHKKLDSDAAGGLDRLDERSPDVMPRREWLAAVAQRYDVRETIDDGRTDDLLYVRDAVVPGGSNADWRWKERRPAAVAREFVAAFRQGAAPVGAILRALPRRSSKCILVGPRIAERPPIRWKTSGRNGVGAGVRH